VFFHILYEKIILQRKIAEAYNKIFFSPQVYFRRNFGHIKTYARPAREVKATACATNSISGYTFDLSASILFTCLALSPGFIFGILYGLYRFTALPLGIGCNKGSIFFVSKNFGWQKHAQEQYFCRTLMLFQIRCFCSMTLIQLFFWLQWNYYLKHC